MFSRGSHNEKWWGGSDKKKGYAILKWNACGKIYAKKRPLRV
jgi:hypothetical protein